MTLLLSATAEAGYNVIGQRNVSCGTWTVARRAHQGLGYEQWVLGFLSGVGWQGSQFGIDPLNGMDGNGVWAWIDNYCQGHPIERLIGAAAAFASTHPH